MKNIFWAVLTIFLVSFLGFSIISSLNNKHSEPEQISFEPEKNMIYFAKIENNVINIYTDISGNKQYYKTVNGANVFDLPEKEYSSLLKGKYFYTPEEVAAFIEVVTS